MFKKQISEQEVREALKDANMRRALFDLIRERAYPDRPCTTLGDDWIKEELRRILK